MDSPIARRGFIGSVIGMVAGTEFYAKAELPKPETLKTHPYFIMFRDSLSGFTIQAPGIKEIVRLPPTPSQDAFGFDFVAEDLHVTKAMKIDQVILHKANGELIAGKKFMPVNMCNGDTFKAQYSVNSPADLTLEELVHFMSRRPLHKRVT